LINFDGSFCDKDINITDKDLRVGLNKFKIFPEYFGFTKLNTILESLNSVSCHHQKTTKPLREVGEIAAPSGDEIYNSFAHGKKLNVIIRQYLAHPIKDVMDTMEKLEAVNMLAMGMKLTEMQRYDYFESWAQLIIKIKVQDQKKNSPIKVLREKDNLPSSSPNTSAEESGTLSASAGSSMFSISP